MKENKDMEPEIEESACVEADEHSDVETEVLPSSEDYSELHEDELREAISEVRQRGVANGGYVTFEELNQLLPQETVDALVAERMLKSLEMQGVQVFPDVYLLPSSAKITENRCHAFSIREMLSLALSNRYL